MERTAIRPQGRGGIAFAFILLLALILAASFQAGGQTAELPPGSPALMQPEELVKILHSGGAKPSILYVGPQFMYMQAHIPGAEFIGPANDPQFLDKLRKRAASLSKHSPILIYCGCCPWEHCPNIRPAYKELQQMGFKNLKVLYLANSLGANWVEKGYPTEKVAPR